MGDTVTHSQTGEKQTSRISLLDAARGLALIAMTIYHFTWDLEFFNWAPPALTLRPEWVYFARGIASSFLFLVGVGLVLGHGEGIRWSGFWKRFLLIAGAAVVISIATYFFMPGGFIFFGILHAIALFSLFGLLFVRLHWLIPAVAAVGVLYVSKNFTSEIFLSPEFWWVGLAPTAPPANDYVPLFPWFAATLFGISAGKLAVKTGVVSAISQWSLPGLLNRPLTFIGRHSLVYYLIHQPLLLGLIWAFTAVAGEPDKTPVFVYQCELECSRSNGPMFCKPYCGCMAETMKAEQLFTPFLNRTLTPEQNHSLHDVRDVCVADQQ